ncbi:hypothetical protein [Levilactobacillus zymae]|uniref:hypothetical protein n=1 Tax=Levilactobacillus zymae TaxID=267363 RepID=UPI0028B4271C|nr:hypothetical protein [Levilactobacillus zymae]MDT6979467.1 hypothetical protein [Levilactobacillus zymae]
MGATEMAALSGLIMAVKSAAPAVVESLNNAYDFAVGDWIRERKISCVNADSFM